MAKIKLTALRKTNPANQSMTIQKGSSFSLAITPKDIGGTPVPTTGYSLKGQFRSAFGKDISRFDAPLS